MCQLQAYAILISMGRMTSIPETTRVQTGAHPLLLPGESRLPAILLLHGYTGYPGDMRHLATALNQAGYTVSVPRYPGHGTNNRDFRASSWRDWLRRGIDAYLDLAGRHEHVVVGGLSMGGLIAAIVAARFPVERLLLFAPAFRTVNPLVALTPILRWVVPPLRNSSPEQYDDAERQYMADEYWNWQWPAQTASLNRLMHIARRSIPDVTVPTLTVVSDADRSVPASVADFIDRRISTEQHYVVRLTESGHVVTNGSERDTVAETVVAWLGDAEVPAATRR